MVADGSSAKQLTVIFNGTHSSIARQLGKVSRSTPIPFSLKLSETGKATVNIGGYTAEFDETALSPAKASVFCSTGQFKFSDVKFTTSA